MQVSIHNKVKVYNLTSGKSLPDWLSERKRNKKIAGGENRIELIHDLEFPHSSRTIFRTPNGSFLFAAGDYPYRLKCFDVNQLSMKYSFNADMPILSGVALSPDYRKFALRGEGRVITVHHTAQILDRIRVPHTQRSLNYHENTCELLSSGASSEIFRVNLETGSFVESYKTASMSGVNGTEVFKGHGLVLTAGCDGAVEAWDARSASCAARLTVCGPEALATSGLTEECELTHVSADDAGLLFACGTENGNVLLYDIRSSKPLLVKDHMNGLKIVKTFFYKGRSSAGDSTHIFSADTRSVKIWNKQDGSNFTTIEAPGDITDFTVLKSQHNMVTPYECDDSGIVCICCDVPRVQVHFIPQLGVAPSWASFLDSITEELEEKDNSIVYDNYQFISNEEMKTLGMKADDLAGGKVRPAMHGCFIESALYRELKAVVDPGAFNRFIADSAKLREKKRWDDRISKFKRVVPPTTENTAEGNLEAAASSDPRFSNLIQQNKAAYALDTNNPEYVKLLAKIDERRKKAAVRQQRYAEDAFAIVPDTEEADAATDKEGDPEVPKGVSGSALLTNLASKAGDRRHKRSREEKPPAAPKAASANSHVTLFESKKGFDFTAGDKQIHHDRKKARAQKLTLAERLQRIGKK